MIFLCIHTLENINFLKTFITIFSDEISCLQYLGNDVSNALKFNQNRSLIYEDTPMKVTTLMTGLTAC